LEAQGYEVWPYILPAAGVGAPHRRERIWFVAHRTDTRIESMQQGGENGIYGLKTSPYTESNKNNRRGPRGLFSEPSRANDERDVTYANSNGQHECHSEHEVYTSQGGFNAFGNAQSCIENGATTNSDIPKREGGIINRSTGKEGTFEGEGRYIGRSVCSVWDEFPTQPPLRNGNDGISTESLRQRLREDSMGHLSEKEIDQIISKATTQWSNETIKAGGNAIVHQVAVNIFKSIQLLIDENT